MQNLSAHAQKGMKLHMTPHYHYYHFLQTTPHTNFIYFKIQYTMNVHFNLGSTEGKEIKKTPKLLRADSETCSPPPLLPVKLVQFSLIHQKSDV